MSRGTLLFCSAVAADPPFLRVAEILARDYGLEGHVLAPEAASLSAIHDAGRLSRDQLVRRYPSLEIHFLSAASGDVERYGFERRSFRKLLRAVSPTHVWMHAEFWEGISHQFLKMYRFKRLPRIISHVEVNHLAATTLFSSRAPFVRRTVLRQRLLWPRINAVSACASISRDCAYRMGLPRTVPVRVNYLPTFGPEASSASLELPWTGDEGFIVGFAGLLTEQKGWRVLLDAIELLPERFKAVIIGTGDQAGALRERVSQSALASRVFCSGAVERSVLLATYPRFDAFVLPSITRPNSVEQFGMVLAEAMACGVPVIGSNSGAIPETIAKAGIVVPEGDPQALAAAIARLSRDPAQRHSLGEAGRERHRLQFTCEAYASSMASLLGIVHGTG